MAQNVLVVGGSGYLGQFLLQHLLGSGKHNVAYTYSSNPLPAELFPAAAAYQVDLTSEAPFEQLLKVWRQQPVHAVVNCAAISQPAQCEKDYQLACKINIPSALVAALKQQQQQQAGDAEPLLIHISTDQVYDGSRAWWREADPTAPVNAYGRSKLAAEQYLVQHWPNSVSLRSSIIYGPQPPAPVGRPLFMQFVEEKLRQGIATSFFSDEYRCPILVQDICRIVGHCLADYPLRPQQPVYNMGGPQRLSRVDIARAVAEHMGYATDSILEGKSADVERGYLSPLDISMDMSLLQADMQEIKLTPLPEALGGMFQADKVLGA